MGQLELVRIVREHEVREGWLIDAAISAVKHESIVGRTHASKTLRVVRANVNKILDDDYRPTIEAARCIVSRSPQDLKEKDFLKDDKHKKDEERLVSIAEDIARSEHREHGLSAALKATGLDSYVMDHIIGGYHRHITIKKARKVIYKKYGGR